MHQRLQPQPIIGCRHFQAMALVPAVALLASCGGMSMMQQQAAAPSAPMVVATAPPTPLPMMALPVEPVAPMLQPTPGIAARERFQVAVNALQQGDSARAEVELKAYLLEVPNSAPARNLLTQIQTPLDMLFPADSFTVQLGQNETLSSLSGIYLGDVLGFYGLARYNGIENPSRVALGQMIRIPRTPSAIAAQAMRASMPAPQASLTQQMTPTMPLVLAPPPQPGAPPRPAPPPARPAPPRDPWVSIRQNVTAGRFEAAIRDAETARVTPDRNQAVILASAYVGNAKATRMTNATQAAAQALRAGQLYLETANRPEDAIEPLELAVMLAPMDNRAQMLLTTAKTRTTDVYYRNGVAAFQRQDLDGAIAAWDKVLALDPNHKNAQLNRAQAIELKQNLQRLR